jgi:hypothetical protein
MALPSFSAAANYAASFRPVEPVDGFEDILSTDAQTTFKEQQYAKFMGHVAMAKQALAEKFATERAKMNQDVQYDTLALYRERDAMKEKAAKRDAIANIMSTPLLGKNTQGMNMNIMDTLSGFNNRAQRLSNQSDAGVMPFMKAVDEFSKTLSGTVFPDEVPGFQQTATPQLKPETFQYERLPSNFNLKDYMDKNKPEVQST